MTIDWRSFCASGGIERAPFYIVVGDESFFKQLVIRSIARYFRTGDVHTIDASTRKGVDILLDEVPRVSLFSATRILVGKEADVLVSDHCDDLLRVLKRSGNSVLVLDIASLDRRTKGAKILDKEGLIIECKRLYDQPAPWVKTAPHETELAIWTAQHAADKGLKMSIQTAYALTEYIGNSPAVIDQTIDKISLYGTKEVKLEDLATFVVRANRWSPFFVVNSLISKSIHSTLNGIKGVFEIGAVGRDGEAISNHGVIASIILTTLWSRIKEIMILVEARCRTKEDAQRLLGKAPFMVIPSLVASRVWTEKDLEIACREIEKAASILKGIEPGPKPQLLIEMLAVRLLNA